VADRKARGAASGDLDQLIADTIYDALRSKNCGGSGALVQGRPAPNETTTIDGSFYLRAVARRIRRKLATEWG